MHNCSTSLACAIKFQQKFMGFSEFEISESVGSKINIFKNLDTSFVKMHCSSGLLCMVLPISYDFAVLKFPISL